jgi:hypothetical protein
MASNPTQELQDEFLSTIRKSQETVIDAIRTWVETVQSAVPKMPSVQVPGADQLPKPEEVVASAYDFAEQLPSPPSSRRGPEDPRVHPVRGSAGKPRSCRVWQSTARSRDLWPFAAIANRPRLGLEQVRKELGALCLPYPHRGRAAASHPDRARPALPGDLAASDTDLQRGRDGRYQGDARTWTSS